MGKAVWFWHVAVTHRVDMGRLNTPWIKEAVVIGEG
jgi:hypothetical protein